MTTTVPYNEPDKITKGDTVSWKKALSCYKPGDGWTLTYYFRGVETLDKAATASGDDHLLSLTAANTDTLTAGDYSWSAKVTDGSEVVTVATGRFTVLTDLADEAAGYETRPYVKRVLDAIESLMEGKVTKDASSYSIQGRSLTRYSFEELEALRDKYKNLWNIYLKKEKRKQGQNTSRKIKVRFNT